MYYILHYAHNGFGARHRLTVLRHQRPQQAETWMKALDEPRFSMALRLSLSAATIWMFNCLDWQVARQTNIVSLTLGWFKMLKHWWTGQRILLNQLVRKILSTSKHWLAFFAGHPLPHRDNVWKGAPKTLLHILLVKYHIIYYIMYNHTDCILYLVRWAIPFVEVPQKKTSWKLTCSSERHFLKIAFHCPRRDADSFPGEYFCTWELIYFPNGWTWLLFFFRDIVFFGSNTSKNPHVNQATLFVTPQLINWRNPSEIPRAPQHSHFPVVERKHQQMLD